VTWFDVVLSSAVAAVVATIDARLARPYWAFSQVLPGVFQVPPFADESIYRELLSDAHVFRRTARRFAYGLVPGVWLGLRYEDLSTLDAAVPGFLTALLLLWPVAFHGLPPVQTRSALFILYAATVAVFGALSAVAYGITSAAVSGQAEGAGGLVIEFLATTLGWFVVLLVASVIARLAWIRLRPLIPWQ
jgi:hypothetical protein